MESAHEDSGPESRPQPFPSFTQPCDDNNTTAPGAAHASNGTNHHPQPQPSKAPSSPSSANSTRDRRISGVIPPYWSHHRNSSRASQTSLEPLPAITLEDHTEDPNSESSRGLWARSVSVDDHAVVQGMTGVGAYVVWNCRIQTLDVSLFYCACWFGVMSGCVLVD